MTEYITAAEASAKLLRQLNELAPGWSAQQPDLAQRLALALADDPNQLLAQMSYEEFLDWLDEDTFAEWEDGKVVLMSPVSRRHQLIANFLTALITEYALRRIRNAHRPALFLSGNLCGSAGELDFHPSRTAI